MTGQASFTLRGRNPDVLKELFGGGEAAVAKAESKLEYAGDLDAVNEDLGVLSEAEADILPITTRAYLYLSGTPFKRSPPASSSRSKSLIGPTPTNSEPRRRVVTKLEPELFLTVTGLTVVDFHLLVRLKGLQRGAHERRGVRVPPLRERLSGLHRHRQPRRADSASCLIPGFDGALFTPERKEALWARFSTGAPRRLRRSVERYSIVKRA